MTDNSRDVEARAAGILRDLEADVSLIGKSHRAWWLKYLRTHLDIYVDVLRLVRRHVVRGRLLEIGSVPGHLTVLLKRLGYDMDAVDLDPSRMQALYVKHDIRVRPLDIETQALPFEEAAFDGVLATELLEHLRLNPLFALAEMRRVLRPGGVILLSVPNITPVHRLRFLFGRDYQGDPVEEFRKIETLGHMGHIRLYSPNDVRRFLEATGFTNVSHCYRGKVQGGWKGKLIRLLLPGREKWRAYLFSTARKPEDTA